VSNPDLERRYRRLLTAYPWTHRRVYEEEMLAVLLAGAQPHQRRPNAADVWNLMVGALRFRLNDAGRGRTQEAWADAAATTGLFTAFALLALSLHAVTQYPDLPTAYSPRWQLEALVAWAGLAGWAAVCGALAVGWRRLAAALAWIGVIGEAASLTLQYGAYPVSVVNTLWQFTLTLMTAATLTVPAPRRRAISLLGPRRLLALLASAATIGIVFLANQFNPPPSLRPGESGTSYVFYGLESTSDMVVWIYMGGIAAACLVGIVAVASLAAPLRWRIAALFTPVLSLLVLVNGTLDGWMASNANMGHAIYLQPAQWVALAGVPLVTLAIAVLAVQRREHIRTMAELGRAVDKQNARI
jgi:hypothetical protein